MVPGVVSVCVCVSGEAGGLEQSRLGSARAPLDSPSVLYLSPKSVQCHFFFLVLAVPGLHCGAQALHQLFSSCSEQGGYSLPVV